MQGVLTKSKDASVVKLKSTKTSILNIPVFVFYQEKLADVSSMDEHIALCLES